MQSALDQIPIFADYPDSGRWYVVLDETPSDTHRARVKIVHSDGRFIVHAEFPNEWPKRVYEIWKWQRWRWASSHCLQLNVAEMKSAAPPQPFRLD